MALSDVHAHLTHPRLRAQVPEILARAQAAGVTAIICNGLNAEDNQAVLALARDNPIVRPAFGLYPVDAVLDEMRAAGVEYPSDESRGGSVEESVAFVRDHVANAIAVGEIGLDGYWVPEPFWPKQEAVFCELVQIAQRADKPIIIHTRKREQRTLDLLLELGATRVDWHCFGGKLKLARKIADHGHYLSIPSNARRSESFRRMLETLPRDQLLFETDCPYLSREPGQSSEPSDVAHTAQFTAELWGCEVARVVEQNADNFRRLFRVDPSLC
ncbi:MAG: TatD family hydrolase [Polyangiales bacterium]